MWQVCRTRKTRPKHIYIWLETIFGIREYIGSIYTFRYTFRCLCDITIHSVTQSYVNKSFCLCQFHFVKSPRIDFSMFSYISMGWCKKDQTLLITHWSYDILALTHRCDPPKQPFPPLPMQYNIAFLYIYIYHLQMIFILFHKVSAITMAPLALF